MTKKKQFDNESEFEKLKKTFLNYKKKAGNVSYVSCFGKTFLDRKTDEYQIAMKVSESIIKNGFGVLHGGYSGIMEAVSRGADNLIESDDTKNKYLNIGVPMSVFDKELKRSSDINLPPAKNIGDRKKILVECCDVCVVLPSGGMGTLLETLEIFHSNQIAEKFGGKIVPIIFIKGKWKSLLNKIYNKLNMDKQKKGNSFIYFAESLEKFESIFLKIIN